MSTPLRPWSTSVLVVMAACLGRTPVAPVAGAPQVASTQAKRNDTCEGARLLRRQARTFYAAGRLERTIQTVRKANRLCLQEAPSSQDLLQRAETELGQGNSSRTGAAATVADGEALLRDGLAKKAQGDGVAAQRLFDRARIVLEHATAERVTLQPSTGIWEVSALAWSGDGARLGIASGQDVRILGGEDFSESLRLSTNAQPVTAIAISPDARMLVSAGRDRDPELWDLDSGARTRTLETPPCTALESLVFSPDGKAIAGRCWGDPSPTLWSVGSQSPARVLTTVYQDRFWGGPRGGTRYGRWPDMLAFSPDGATLASVHERNLMFWDLRSDGTGPSRVLQAPDPRSAGESLFSIAFHPSGRSIAASGESGRMLVWSGFGGTAPRTVQASRSSARLAFSRDGDSVLSVSSEGELRTYATKTLTRLASLEAGAGMVSAVAPRPDAGSAAIATDGGLRLVDAASGQRTEVVRRPLAFSSLAVSQDGAHVAVGTAAGAVLLVSPIDGSFAWLRGHSAEVGSLVFSPDGRRLATASRDKTARVWDLLGRKSLHVFKHPEPLNAVAFQPGGRVLATAGENGMVRVWDATSGENLATLSGTSCAVLSVAFSPDGSLLAANVSDHTLLRWNAQTYAGLPQMANHADCEGELRASANTLGFASDGKTMASGIGNSVEISNAQDGQQQAAFADPEGLQLRSVAVSPNEPVVAAAVGAKVRRWHLPDGAELSTLAPGTPLEQVDSVAFSADGRWLFGAGRRGDLSIWALPAGTLELTLHWADETSAFALIPSGRMEWLGSNKAPATCRLGSHVYPVELCEERYVSTGLVGSVFAHRGSMIEGAQDLTSPHEILDELDPL